MVQPIKVHPIKGKLVRKGPAKLPPDALKRFLPHDERLPRRVSKPPRKTHKVVTAVIVGLLLFTALLFVALRFIPWEFRERDAAIVNGERVPLDDFNAQYKTLPPEVKAQFTELQFLNDTIIPQTLILQEAKKRGLTASEEDMQQALQDILAANGVTLEQFKAKLDSFGLPDADFQRLLEKRVIINKLLNDTLDRQIVTEEEVKAFFEINRAYFTSTYGNITVQDAAPSIKAYLETQKNLLAMQQYVDSLRANASIIINTKYFE